MVNTLDYEKFVPESLVVHDPPHEFQTDDLRALWAAYAARRPLLLRGLPGTGKSQTARAIASHLGWAYVEQIINSNTELSDLHYSFDAIGRLGEAQILGAGAREHDIQDLDTLNFLSPSAFWWAYDWVTAKQQFARCKTSAGRQPVEPKGWSRENGGIVLLLDEIDKAQPDLANGLLETLDDRRQFNVPYLSVKRELQAGEKPLHNPISADKGRDILVIFTTNEERELPQAFLRRCFVHTLSMELSTALDSDFELEGLDTGKFTKEEIEEQGYMQKRLTWLIKRGQLHFETAVDPNVYYLAAWLLWQDRGASSFYKPGLAEYIDLLRALSKIENPDEQFARLKEISKFALQKGLEN